MPPSFDVPRAILPEVRNTSDDFGVAAKDHLGLETPIAAVVGDQQAGLIGQACFSPGMCWRDPSSRRARRFNGCGMRSASLRPPQRRPRSPPKPIQSRRSISCRLSWGSARPIGRARPARRSPASHGNDAQGTGARRARCGRLSDARSQSTPCGRTPPPPVSPPPTPRSGSTAACPSATGRCSSSPTSSTCPSIAPPRPRHTALGAAFVAGWRVGLYPDPVTFAKTWRCVRRFAPGMLAGVRDRRLRGWRDAVVKTLHRGSSVAARAGLGAAPGGPSTEQDEFKPLRSRPRERSNAGDHRAP